MQMLSDRFILLSHPHPSINNFDKINFFVIFKWKSLSHEKATGGNGGLGRWKISKVRLPRGNTWVEREAHGHEKGKDRGLGTAPSSVYADIFVSGIQKAVYWEVWLVDWLAGWCEAQHSRAITCVEFNTASASHGLCDLVQVIYLPAYDTWVLWGVHEIFLYTVLWTVPGSSWSINVSLWGAIAYTTWGSPPAISRLQAVSLMRSFRNR